MPVVRPIAFWMFMVVFSIVGSTLFHLDTALGRRLGRDILNDYVTGEMFGELEIGEFTQLRLWKTIAKDTRVYDPAGREVIYGETVHLVIDPFAGMLGNLRFAKSELWNGRVNLIDNENGEPTFLDAFDSPPSDDPTAEPFHAYVERMDLRNVEVEGDLLGLRGLRIVDMHLRGRMEFYWTTDIEVTSATGRIIEPFPFEGNLESLVASYYDDVRGAEITAEASRGEERIEMNMTFRPPEGGTVEDDFELDLNLYANPVSAQTLRDVGFDWAAMANGSTRGTVRLHGPGDELSMEASLETDAGAALIQGELSDDKTSRIEIISDELILPDIIKGSPDITIGGTVAFVMPPEEDAPTRLEVDIQPFDYEEWAIPHFTANVSIGDTSAKIHALKADYAGGELNVDGDVAYTGAAKLHARGNIPEMADDPNIQSYVPGIQGGAEFDLVIEQRKNWLGVTGWASLDDLVYGILDAHSLHVEGTIRGDPSKPKLDLNLEGGDIEVLGYPFGHGDWEIEGGPSRYETAGAFAATGQRRTEFHAVIQRQGSSFVLNADSVELAVGNLVWRGTVKNATSDLKSEFQFDKIQFANGNQRIDVGGIWRFDGEDDIVADVQDFDLAALRLILPYDDPNVRGNLNLHFEFKGDLDRRPVIVAEGTLRDAYILDIEPITAAYLLSFGNGNVEADAQIDLGGGGTLSLALSGLVDPEVANIVTALEGGVYEVDLNGGAFDLKLLERFLGKDWESFSGYADANLHISGPIDAPSFKGTASIPQLKTKNWAGDGLGLESIFQYEYGSLVARVTGTDPQGQLFDLEGSLLIDLVYLVREPQKAVSTLDTSPWRLSARIPPRTLDALPKHYLRRFPEGVENLQVAASLTLTGGAFRTRGDLHASLDWRGERGNVLCASQSDPRITIRGQLEDDRTEFEIDGLINSRKVLRVQASAPTPLDAWLRRATQPELPPTQLTATLDGVPTEEIPIFCRYASGPVDASLTLNDLFAARPELAFMLESKALQARRIEPALGQNSTSSVVETPPAELKLEAGFKDGVGTLNGLMKWWNAGGTSLEATAPLAWGGEHKMPSLAAKGQLKADATFDRMPLQAVLAWMAGVVNVEGIMQGQFRARGPVQSPQLSGDVLVSDGRVQLRTVGQTLDDVEGQVIFNRDGELEFDVHGADGSGQLSAVGKLMLDGLKPSRADFRVKATEFPLRQEGSIRATIAANTEFKANFKDEGLEGQVNITQLDVDIPETIGSPQSLDQHPDVVFVNEDQGPSETGTPYLVALEIDASERFQVRSEEQGFAAEASARLGVEYDAESFLVNGILELYTGYFLVFGKKFDVLSGSMNFTGDSGFNPQVSLVAKHSLRGQAGQTITITVTGTLDNPVVDFSSTVETESEAQIIALLLTGRTRTERGAQTATRDAGQEATNFLAGVAGGLFTSTLRGQFGGYAPTVGVRASGSERTETQVQVGFNVDSVIPDRYRDVIQGLYVEGSFTTRQDDGGGTYTTGQAQRTGFLIETLWPKSIGVTGTFAPPSNWSIDVTWEP